MAVVNIYLNFKGNCKAAFDLYRSAFGKEFSMVRTYGEMPPQEGMPAPSEEMKKQIIHISLPISRETILMGSDAPGVWADQFVQGNNFSISVNTTDKEETEWIFNVLAEGGKVTMPLAKTFFSEYYGMLTDKFGINWMVGVPAPTV